jgi:hypothetical protein
MMQKSIVLGSVIGTIFGAVIGAGFGAITSTAGDPRIGQLAAKLLF